MKKRLLIVLMVFLMSIPLVRADSISTEEGFLLQSECLNDTILHEYINLNVSGSEIYIDGGNVTCNYGCNSVTAECYGQPNEKLYLWGLGFFFICFGLMLFGIAATGKLGPDNSDNHEW